MGALGLTHGRRGAADQEGGRLIARPDAQPLAHDMCCGGLPVQRRQTHSPSVRECEVVQIVVEPKSAPVFGDHRRQRLGRLARPHHAERDVADQLVAGVRDDAREDAALHRDTDQQWPVELVVHVVQPVRVVQELGDGVGVGGRRYTERDLVAGVRIRRAPRRLPGLVRPPAVGTGDVELEPLALLRQIVQRGQRVELAGRGEARRQRTE